MTSRYKFTITLEHVRNPRSLGRDYYPLAQCMGRLLSNDVGKRVYDCGNGVWQVENDEQRDHRLAQARLFRFGIWVVPENADEAVAAVLYGALDWPSKCEWHIPGTFWNESEEARTAT